MSDRDLSAVIDVSNGSNGIEQDAQQRAIDRAASGCCIHCNRGTATGEKLRRGLCAQHYQQFYLEYRSVTSMGKRRAQKWLVAAIRAGYVLSTGLFQRSKQPNVFKRISNR